ncbi:hypothetical protein GCM10027346_23880 [Hymenobacter seoulensis]
MKIRLLSFVLLTCGVSARAQLLPVPGASNPDWTLVKKHTPPASPGDSGPMPTDRMPNGAPKGVTSMGNHHFHWDSERELTYEWDSRPGSGTVAPDKAVTVHERKTNSTYTFRRRAQPVGRPQALPSPSTPSK